MSGPTGLLLVTMEPQALSEEEFNDWYDMEHIPERIAVDGFQSAQRYVCVEGWPKYMAIYDLDDLDVLESPGYLASSRENTSPWSKRVVPRVQGQHRIEATQLYPGGVPTLTGDRRGRLCLIRFRGVPTDEIGKSVIAGLRRRFENLPGVAQLRVFRIENHGGTDYLAVVEERVPLTDHSLDPALFGDYAGTVDLVNVYSPYWRRSPLPGVM